MNLLINSKTMLQRLFRVDARDLRSEKRQMRSAGVSLSRIQTDSRNHRGAISFLTFLNKKCYRAATILHQRRTHTPELDMAVLLPSRGEREREKRNHHGSSRRAAGWRNSRRSCAAHAAADAAAFHLEPRHPSQVRVFGPAANRYFHLQLPQIGHHVAATHCLVSVVASPARRRDNKQNSTTVLPTRFRLRTLFGD